MIEQRKKQPTLVPVTVVLLLAPVAILVDTVMAWWQGYRPMRGSEKAVIVGAAAFAVVVIAMLLVPRVRAMIRRLRHQIVALVVTMIVCLIGAEVVIGTFVQPRAEFHRRRAHLDYVIGGAPEVMPGVHGDAHVSTNAEGVRGPEMPAPADAVHILFIGGSTTECLNLDDSETWPHLVMTAINDSATGSRVWAGNIGMSGTSTRHHAQFLERDPLARSIDCVVVQAGVNDLQHAIYRSDYQMDPNLLPKPRWFRSSLYRTYLKYRIRKGQARLGRVDAKGPGGRFYAGLRQRRADATITEEVPDLRAELEGYEARLRRMIEACRKRDVPILFTSQPVLWDGDLDEDARALLWFGNLRDGRFLSVEALCSTMDAYNEVVRRVCAHERVPFVDLGSMNGRAEYFYDDCHFNEAGAREVARRVAEQLTMGVLEGAPAGKQ